MGTAGSGRRDSHCGRRDHIGSRHRLSHPRVPRKHGFARTRLARQIPFRGGHPTTAVRNHFRRPRDDDSQSRLDDEGQANGSSRRTPHRGRHAFAFWRGCMAELAAADCGRAQGQGRSRRFLDLFLHQLSAGNPLCQAWAEKYKDQGLVVIGVHAPEFAFEKNIDNVKKAVSDLKITYPVAIDNDYAIWRAFSNQYWPAHYFIDAEGVSGTTISAKAIMRDPSGRSSSSSGRPARPTNPLASSQ